MAMGNMFLTGMENTFTQIPFVTEADWKGIEQHWFRYNSIAIYHNMFTYAFTLLFCIGGR